MGLGVAHFKDLAIGKAGMLALDDPTITHYIKYALAVIVSFGYSEPADGDHSDNESGHLAIVEMATSLFDGSVGGAEVGNIKKEKLGSWSVEYVTGDERVSTKVLPPIVVALLTKYLLSPVLPPDEKVPTRFANPAPSSDRQYDD